MRGLASLLLLAGLAVPLPAAADDAVAGLIRRLGSDEFAERVEAAERLVALGEAAWPALRKAADHPDPEVRKAAADARDRIAATLFAPLRTFEGHEGQVNCVAVTPDGRRLLTGGLDATLRLWDAATGEEVWRHTEAPGGVWCVAVSPDGRFVLSCLGMHEDGGRWARGNDHAVRLWDLTARKLVRTFEGHTDEVRGLAFTPDGKLALSGALDKTARLWDVATGKEVRRFEGHAAALRRVALAPDGKRALTGSLDGTARVWDVATGEEVSRFALHGADVLAVAFTPDGRHAVSAGADKSIRLWDAATGREVRRFQGHASVVWDVAVSPDGRRLLSAGGTHAIMIGHYRPSGADYDARLWDLASGVEVHRYPGHTRPVMGVAFGPDGRTAATCGSDGTLRTWKVAAP